MNSPLARTAVEFTRALGQRREWLASGQLAPEAHRVFHGPADGSDWRREIAIDRYGNYAWVTAWDSLGESERAELAEVMGKEFAGAVILRRPPKGVPNPAEIFFGTVPSSFMVNEDGAKFIIRLEGERHPGLFLDHAWLRSWLKRNALGARVLNLFSYTASLSVSAALAASGDSPVRQIISVDLSRPTSDWATENGRLNGLKVVPIAEGDALRKQGAASASFLANDVFQFLAAARKRREKYDTVICDPPSFSRSKTGVTFSTDKDTARLHADIADILSPGGLVITSINSAQITPTRFESMVQQGFGGRKLEKLAVLSQPESFGGKPHAQSMLPEDFYLKGLIVRVR